MVETDWKEILSFTQRELNQSDKEKLCEGLCWMEADDIELNFTDLKTLFRLAQDILKLKSEQVNNLIGQLKSTQRKTSKTRVESPYAVSPTQSNDSALETITHQEEIIKANKEILEQLYSDIADLESKKSKLVGSSSKDLDSESSRDALSELNAIAELEREVTVKNRHIRKLLSDIKVLEEENTKLKEKVSILKDKLTEATGLIDNLTEQMLMINNECTQLKDILGKTEQGKSKLSIEIEELKNKLDNKEFDKNHMFQEIKSKVQHWKAIAKEKKTEADSLSNENLKLKEDLSNTIKLRLPSKLNTSPQKPVEDSTKVKELQDKLLEASKEMEHTADIINLLRTENKKLKSKIEEIPDHSVTETKNQSDDRKEITEITKLKKKVQHLSESLQNTEDLLGSKEKELAEVTSQLQLLGSEDGIHTLLESLKSKKRLVKSKDEGIKSLVKETNSLNEIIDELQLENETLRQKCNISPAKKICTKGIMKNYHDLQDLNHKMKKTIKITENKLVELELNNYRFNSNIHNLVKFLNELGYTKDELLKIIESSETNGALAVVETSKSVTVKPSKARVSQQNEEQMLKIIEENKGLRQGMQEILDFLKDNSKTSAGILTLKCPSLEKLLSSMEARNLAGWFSPHMTTVMELKAALGGKDALLTALHDARKETFEVMAQLSKATQKSTALEQKIHDLELNEVNKKPETKDPNEMNNDFWEFGSWISDKKQTDVDIFDKSQIESLVEASNSLYERQLKKALEYFHMKFIDLYDKLNTLVIQTSDDKNKWSVQEDCYKATIHNLQSQLNLDMDEDSDISPGIIPIHDITYIRRKCTYLEESYKYVKTMNENMKNEILEIRRDAMATTSLQETQIQKLILYISALTDKLRCSISLELFWKQNEVVNDVTTKYRKVLENTFYKETNCSEPLQQLEGKTIVQNMIELTTNSADTTTERTIFQKQLELVCNELRGKNKIIQELERKNSELHSLQKKLIDETLSGVTVIEMNSLKDQSFTLVEENKILKEQCHHVSNQLDIVLLQLQDKQQREMSKDLEVNMLQHQILDLQSQSDNKAIIARLSGEILVAHMQASDSHKSIERLNTALTKEKELRAEAEEMIMSRQKIFEVYSKRYESKFKYIFEVMQTLRQQYQGSIPLISVENYLNKFEDLIRKDHAVDEKLSEIEDLRSSLISKHSIYDQILDVSKDKCLVDETSCPHKLKFIMNQSKNTRDLSHVNQKLKGLEKSHDDLTTYCNKLEKTLLLVSQGFEKGESLQKSLSKEGTYTKVEVEDIPSDDESLDRKSQTITLPNPKVLKTNTKPNPDSVNDSSFNIIERQETARKNVDVQTINTAIQTQNHTTQTDFRDEMSHTLNLNINKLKKELNSKDSKISESIHVNHTLTQEITSLKKEVVSLESSVDHLRDINNQKDVLHTKLESTINELQKELNTIKRNVLKDREKFKENIDQENKTLLLSMKQLENDKNAVVLEYKQLLDNEREEYAKTVKELQVKHMELQSKLDRRGSESTVNGDGLKEVVTKYSIKIAESEDKVFKIQSELDECKSELSLYKSEADRWKELATERLTKMEQLNSQLEERHCHEVKSYKDENQHWLTQLNDMQREHMDLRTRLTDQKTAYIKQLSDKDIQIEQLRVVNHNLKTQIMNMQTLISVNDPSFDLSAIVEVDESSDVSQQGSDRLELKFDSSIDLQDSHDDIVRFPATSTTIWQEPVIERLRREKQLAGKQNSILRRQIKVLASRERRARLDAQNLKNQVFRISTTGNKVTTAETASLHNKIASLQAQLTSARRDTHSSIALWDKWKRSQQAAERWQARFEDKNQEVTKLEASLHLAKSALSRLEKEKRVLLSRLSEFKSDHQLSAIEKQDSESQEKSLRSIRECMCSGTLPVSPQALLDRVEAQQRRIAALEVAEMGNERLVSEYEKSLAEITSLKGQVLKLESTLLESQIRTPIKSKSDTQPELDYFKSYCEMLKDENIQLTQKINSLETLPTTTHQHRVSDLEQTVLTLRGVVSKLQAEQKTGGSLKRIDSRPNSSRSSTDKFTGRSQLETHRIEIANLKRTIHDKDLLLEKSKEMLKIAAEREDELLRENAYLRRQLDDITRPKGGFLSA